MSRIFSSRSEELEQCHLPLHDPTSQFSPGSLELQLSRTPAPCHPPGTSHSMCPSRFVSLLLLVPAMVTHPPSSLP